jgi:hypothetical protein
MMMTTMTGGTALSYLNASLHPKNNSKGLLRKRSSGDPMATGGEALEGFDVWFVMFCLEF